MQIVFTRADTNGNNLIELWLLEIINVLDLFISENLEAIS